MVPVIFNIKLTANAILYPFDYLKKCVSYPYPEFESQLILLLEIIKYGCRKEIIIIKPANI